VEFVYRHFPLTTIHKNAQIAAQAAEAAGLQEKFFPMHDKLFMAQSSWATLADPRETFAVFATELGIDKDKFLSDIDSQVVKDAVSVDMLAASRYALSGTPTFFVNGVKTEFGSLEGKIQELLK
jgi:protein-disulfide isomerase